MRSTGSKACLVLLLAVAMATSAPAQVFKNLVNFGDGTAIGMEPGYLSLVQGTDGNLYGTTKFGGPNAGGTIFKMTTGGTLTTIYSLCAQPNCGDGADPVAGLVLATDGNFYGTTYAGGGSSNCTGGCGTLFRVTPGGALLVLHSFSYTDGATPQDALVQAIDGNFYGTTTNGGTNGDGTVFKITANGVLTTVYSFCSLPSCADSHFPYAGLIQATDGNFYGTTAGESSLYDFGTVFKLTPAGVLTTLYAFSYQPNVGTGPIGGLYQSTNGIFYGTTPFGGDINNCLSGEGCGTVFGLSTNLGPFVAFLRGAAKSGEAFGILGQGLTGTTAVSLNGTSATFSVKSSTLIVATVPPGATTGYVTVTTPSGTLTSNKPFYVIP